MTDNNVEPTQVNIELAFTQFNVADWDITINTAPEPIGNITIK